MIHNVLITNATGNILLSKYYDGSTEDDQFAFEGKLVELTQNLECHDNHQVALYQDKFIVFTYVGELSIFITGSKEYDELALSMILDHFGNALKHVCKKGVNETEIVQQYHKINLYLDEMIKKGILDQVQYDSIYNYSHMKYDKS